MDTEGQSRSVLVDNPILWYEAVPKRLRHAKTLSLSSLLLIAAAGSLAVGLLVAIWDSEIGMVTGSVISYIWSAVTVIVIPLQAAAKIVQERQRGTWDALILTRMNPAQIVFGKLLAVALPYWIFGLLLIPFMAMQFLAAPFSEHLYQITLFEVGALALTYYHAILISGSLCMVGLYFSLIYANTHGAQLMTLLVGFGLWVAYTLLIILISLETDYIQMVAVREIIMLALVSVPGGLALFAMLTRFYQLDGARRR